jgi:hypothetical protein
MKQPHKVDDSGLETPIASDSCFNSAATALRPSHINSAAGRLQLAISSASRPPDPVRAGAVFVALRRSIAGSPGERSTRWRIATAQIARTMGYSRTLLELSINALVRPLEQASDFARKLQMRRQLFGFIMPGNVPGAGLHELVTALMAGSGVIVKTPASEPVFFAELAATLRELDSHFGTDFGNHIEVFNWGRERSDLTQTLIEACERVVVLGDDSTIALLEGLDSSLIGFGTRVSGAVVLRDAVQDDAGLEATARALALDCALFDQRGCLSPHHIFVEERAGEFAARIAAGFAECAPRWRGDTSRRMELEAAAAVRSVRESARWRAIGGAAVKLWEGSDFDWTVVFDREARFNVVPGFCTIFVSPFATLTDLERRLEAVRGRLEGFAVAGRGAEMDAARAILHRLGATYVCLPGEMQSPPLGWPHGGGVFLRMMLGQR